MPRHSNPNYAGNPVQRRAKEPPDAKREEETRIHGLGWVSGTWGRREIEEKWERKRKKLGQTGEKER
jgi:hypothetical protein